ncbi:heptaprenylglyceryl phosphate synthase [Paenibacillus nasutitermitis]|uniref:Heptaprenylglyceryl phosphate synthase n=1 Tax=Paenibacillus nasutitermitis TaxID=1652958 RepID=A0A917E1Y6_9BACL|nr:heptaprenylglyceryl phosphate synthase [Paenibacillus nasutitermitis]GGD91854.1 heptaprenylglyceryl phosphate synthase [Paenibacillus nasutitermitis]
MQAEIYSTWRHLFKLDPDRSLTDEALDAVCLSGTDGIIVGGSSGVTYDNTVELLSRIRRYEVPCALEVSDEEAAVPGFDHYFIPMVLNTSRVEWVIGRQVQALRKFGAFIPWQETSAQGYLMLNGESTAAKVSEADTELSVEEVEAYLYMADRLMHLPVVYMEYSGMFGDLPLVARMRRRLQGARLFYGGGIDTPGKARQAAEAAHTVIVGNAVYESLEQALQTVGAVRCAELL